MARFICLTLAGDGRPALVNVDAIGYFTDPPEDMETKAGAGVSFAVNPDEIVPVKESTDRILELIRHAAVC